MRARIVFVAMLMLVPNTFIAAVVEGRPSYAINRNNYCSACHTNEVTGRMEVAQNDTITDLGTQLDDNVRGPLKTYQTGPGSIVTLAVNVLDGNDKFAVQIKDFEKSARKNSRDNFLIWSPANGGDNTWTRQENGNPVYFTKDNGSNGGISGSISPTTYTFDLLIDPATPMDFYELVLAVPGTKSGFIKVYQEEHFYIEVYCPYDIPGDVNDDCRVDFSDFALMASSWLADCLIDNTDPACIPK